MIAVNLASFAEHRKRERRVNLFPSLLIDLEVYAIVIGLSIAAFVFLVRERLRRLKENPDGGRTPPVEDTNAVRNSFMRAGHTF